MPKSLTVTPINCMLSLLQKTAIGRRNLIKKGSNRPQFTVVFLCVSFCAAFSRSHSLWRAYTGSVWRWLVPFSSFRPRVSMPPNIVENIAGGYSPQKRNTAMKNHSIGPNAAQNQKAKTISLFNIFLHRQLIVSAIDGALAERIKRRNPAIVVKHSHMERAA